MRVLVVSREVPPVGGGAGRVALDLARHLTVRGHSVRVLTMHHGTLPIEETVDGVAVERLRVGRRHRDSSYGPSMIRFVWAAIRRARRLGSSETFDLVHAHAIVPDGFAARRIARRLGIPYAVTAHGTDVPGYDERRFRLAHRILAPLWRRIVRGAALVTTPSRYLSGLILDRLPGTTVTVIPNGIDTAAFEAKPKDQSFLIVSRLIARKNYAAFFEALAFIDDPVDVHIVGDGPERPRLEGMADGTHHRVMFHGWLDHGSKVWRDLYETCRFFVFPSVGENFPVNLLEAQLAGMVVLAAPADGSREVLGDAAEYFADPSPGAITTTLRRVLAMTPGDLDAIGGRARLRVLDRFAWDAVAQRYVAAFGEITMSPTDE